MNSRYTGAWTALVTPFKKDYSVDWEALEANVMFQVEQGITGVLPMGTTGESATVTHEEHAKIIANTVAYVNEKAQVLAGTGSNSTQEAIQETRLAVQSGVQCCLLVDCYYNKPSSMELRKEYYSVLLEEFADIDFIAYAIPGRSVTVISPEDLCILRDEFKNIVAVKEATGDFERMRRTRQLLDNDFNILSGDDPNTLQMMSDNSINASGVVSVLSNILPKPAQRLTELVLENEVDHAAEVDEALSPISSLIGVSTQEDVKLPNGEVAKVTYKYPNPVPVKTMMRGLGMIDNLCKQPLGRLSPQGVKLVRDALTKVYEQTPKYLEPIGDFFDVDVQHRLADDELWKSLSY